MSIFDPIGKDYDYENAKKYGIAPDKTGHWASRAPLPDYDAFKLGLPMGSGLILKGTGHKTFDKTIKGEEDAGFEIIKGNDSRYYSIPKQQIPSASFFQFLKQNK